MSCECACVVTDVGDSAMIVGEYGVVVESNSVDSLYKGLEKMVQSDYKKFGILSHKRIEENFSTQKMTTRTENLIKEVLKWQVLKLIE